MTRYSTYITKKNAAQERTEDGKYLKIYYKWQTQLSTYQHLRVKMRTLRFASNFRMYVLLYRNYNVCIYKNLVVRLERLRINYPKE